MKTIKQKQLIEQTNIPARLVRAVVRQFGGWQSFTESAPDVCRGGIDGGFSGFTYYSDTEAFAKRHKDLISELASSQAQEIGYDSTFAMIRGFGCFKGDTLTDGELMRALCLGKNPVDGPNILNGLAWYAGEEVCREYCLATGQD
jgi:hypothetical protein